MLTPQIFKFPVFDKEELGGTIYLSTTGLIHSLVIKGQHTQVKRLIHLLWLYFKPYEEGKLGTARDRRWRPTEE